MARVLAIQHGRP